MSCSICYDGSFEAFSSTRPSGPEENGILRLHCGHAYHGSCLASWWYVASTIRCPYCKKHNARRALETSTAVEKAMKSYILFVIFFALAAIGRMSTGFSVVVSFICAALLVSENPLVPLTLVMCALTLSPGVEKPLADIFLRTLYIAGPTFSLACFVWPFLYT